VAELFINPELPNYFVSAPDVTDAESARSFVREFENAMVVSFPNLKANIDHDFWAALDTDRYPGLRKFSPQVNLEDPADTTVHRKTLLDRGVDKPTTTALCDQFRAIYEAVLPAYRAIFGSYQFTNQKVVWRLNTIMNENMHLDVYADEVEDHFARMFINLDTQPRIWHTSWTVDDMVARLEGTLPRELLLHGSRADIWKELTFSIFGRSPQHWWDSEPRHVAYFAPGDIWIVDSRQVAHQIFYGRRALSIDFTVRRESMQDPDRHYLNFVDRFRANSLDRKRQVRRQVRNLLGKVSLKPSASEP
jgi:hypothetical protein